MERVEYESLTEEEESDEETEDLLRDELDKSEEYTSGSEGTDGEEPPPEDLAEMLEGPEQAAGELEREGPMPVALVEADEEREEPEIKKRREEPPPMEV